MASFLTKLFGRSSDDAKQAEPQLSDVDKKIAEIRNTVMDLQSKGKTIAAEREKLREEIRQKDLEYKRLLDEYESLPDGLEKEMVMGTLMTNEEVLTEFRKRVDGLNKAWGDNEKLRQIMKRTLERLIAAKNAGKSMEEIASIIDETAREGESADAGLYGVTAAGERLDGASTSSVTADINREKVLAKLAARKAAKPQDAPQQPPAQPSHETERPQRPYPASQY